MLVGVLRRLGFGGNAPGSIGAGDDVRRILGGLITRFTITGADGTPYLTRWYLFKSSWVKIYLHQIHRSDEDRALHDHPWRFISFLLWGQGYREYQPDGSIKYYPPFSVNVRWDPGKPHRLEVDPRGPPQWSLLLVGRKRREWGFHVPPVELEGLQIAPSLERSSYVPGTFWVDHHAFLDDRFGEGNWTKEPHYYDEEINTQGA